MNSDAIYMDGLVAVCPKTDCPHCLPENIRSLQELITLGKKATDLCIQCEIGGEVWLCLTCAEVHCSRYVEGHMSLHNASTGHHTAFSFADFSYWCYTCDSYIVHPILDHHKENHTEGVDSFYNQKFGTEEDGQAVLQKIRDSRHVPQEDKEEQ